MHNGKDIIWRFTARCITTESYRNGCFLNRPTRPGVDQNEPENDKTKQNKTKKKNKKKKKTHKKKHTQKNNNNKQNKTKITTTSVHPAKSQISHHLVAKGPFFLHADSEGSDQTVRINRLIRVFAGCSYDFVKTKQK